MSQYVTAHSFQSADKFYFNLLSSRFPIANPVFAFKELIADLPVLFSICARATFAALAPSTATCALSSKLTGYRSMEISVAATSANMLSTNSVLVMLSRRFSFFKSLCFLYSRVVIPLHVLHIRSVNSAYSLPCCTPLLSHSSVRALRTFDGFDTLVDPIFAVTQTPIIPYGTF